MILASGCGFHLRGAEDSGFVNVPIALSGDTENRFANTLRDVMDDQRVVLSANADVAIRLFKDQQEKRTLSISSQAQSAEYELVKRVTFSVEDTAQKTTLLPRTDLEARRRYVSDTRYPGAMFQQEQDTWEALNREISRRVLARTQRALPKP